MLKTALTCRGVAGGPRPTCHEEGQLDVFLKVRHSSNLKLRNIEVKVSREKILTQIIERRVLESLEHSNRDMLLAGRGKYGREIDVQKRMIRDGSLEESAAEIAALFGELGSEILE